MNQQNSSAQQLHPAEVELQRFEDKIPDPPPAGELQQETGKGGSGKILELLLTSRYDESIPPPDNPAIASLNNTGVIWKGNVHTLVAGSKVGKSRFLAALIRSLVKGVRSLGWSENAGGTRVISLDFEQDREDFYNAMRHQAGVTKDEVYAFNLPGLSPTDAIACVEAALEKFQGADLLLLDGIADLCFNVNDPEESSVLVARLMALAVTHDVAILGVLHLNPGSDVKSRGHLGSQLERKSKTVFQIDCDAEGVRTAYTKMARKKPIPEKDGVRFKWCNTEGNMVEIMETKTQEQLRIEKEDLRDMMVEIMETWILKEFTHKELVKALMAHTDKRTSTAKTMIRKMVDYGIMTKTNRIYRFNESTK